MLKQLIRPIYTWTHDLLYKTSDWNPIFRQLHGAQSVVKGHISVEHLKNPTLDLQLAKAFREAGISVSEFTININAYRLYLAKFQYPSDYYGGGYDPENNFTEKTLEHYVSTEFISFGS